jgi:hypothetical protein
MYSKILCAGNFLSNRRISPVAAMLRCQIIIGMMLAPNKCKAVVISFSEKKAVNDLLRRSISILPFSATEIKPERCK